MEVFLFKVKDYTTILIGQKYDEGFFVQRGDGTKYKYENYRIEWSKPYLQTIHNKDYAEIPSAGQLYAKVKNRITFEDCEVILKMIKLGHFA